MLTITPEIKSAIQSRTRSIARNLIARDKENAEETAYSLPDGELRDLMLATIREIRKQDELRSWNKGKVRVYSE